VFVKWMVIAGALLAAAGVGLGAFGAHGLEKHLVSSGYTENVSQRMAWFDTGVRYHVYHALAIVLVAALAGRSPSTGFQIAAVLLIVGIAFFSGSLYAMTFGPAAWKKLGAVTPLGGLAFLAAWVTLAIAAWRAN
jgi:uncharacterized membrane protein YgdD (TMEM256/DUF423 family)